jgi:hypothetical protein
MCSTDSKSTLSDNSSLWLISVGGGGQPNEALADLHERFADDLQLALGKWMATHVFTLHLVFFLVFWGVVL